MDPLGLLLEIVALAVYPGGLFLAALAWLMRRAGGQSGGTALDVRGLVAIVAATLAASMASLPGDPAASLPPPGGAAPNLAAALLLIFAAGSLVAPHPWSRRRLVMLVLGSLSLALVALVSASFSVATLAGASGNTAATARVLAVITALVVLPLAVQPQLRTGPVGARMTVAAATVELLLGTLISPSLQWPSAIAAVAALVVAAVLYALVLRLGRPATRLEHPVMVGIVAACCAAATVATVIAARP
jgi:hypothetical protein